jgi:3-oxoacyl-[acyl-carrier-protein] synthase II
MEGKMASARNKNGRPTVVVTGMGVITSLGAGKAENWAKLMEGRSGIHRISRFPNEGLKTTIAGTVDFVPVEPFCSTELGERMAALVAEEAIAEAGIGVKGDFPGPLFLAVAPVEIEWLHRESFAAASGADDSVGYDDLLRASASGRFHAIHERCLFGSVAGHLADRFGTKGSPISVSTACASGASAIQLGVEAVRRGEADAALCIGTDGSVNPECLIRFSLLSALSTANDPPEAAAKPFSKNRDGFVMAEGAAALVIENYESAKARGAKILGVLAGFGEMADSFHRTRSSPDGKAIIGCIRNAVADAGLTPDDIDYINPHGTARERQNGISRHIDRVRRTREINPGLLEQIHGRAYAIGGGKRRDGIHAADIAAPAPAADHQLPSP